MKQARNSHAGETIGEAADALLKGRYDQIEGAGKDELDRMLAEAGTRGNDGTLTEADSSALSSKRHGRRGDLRNTRRRADGQDAVRRDAEDSSANCAATCWRRGRVGLSGGKETGTLGGDAELPLMERLLTTDEQAMDELESIYAARDELLADKAEMRRAREEENAQALSDAREAALNGTASEEQLTLVRENAQVDQDELNADMGYVGRLAAVDDYFRPGAGQNAVSPFEAGSVKLNLDAQGVIDTGDYQAQLREQMDALLEEDADGACAGLTLDEY
ncbi:MAG: hypothetical protein ACLS7Z_10955 [Christensenellales bacterium]